MIRFFLSLAFLLRCTNADHDDITCAERTCAALGEACESDQQCIGPDPAVTCFNQKCVRVPGFGEGCDPDEEETPECGGGFSCVNVSSTEARCIVPTFAGGDCVADVDCLTRLATCTNGKCDGIPEGEECEDDGDCQPGHECDWNNTLRTQACTRVAFPDEACGSSADVDSLQCIRLASCLNDICVALYSKSNGFNASGHAQVCKTAFVNSDGICANSPVVPVVNETSSCVTNRDCEDEDGDDGTCVCQAPATSGKCETQNYISPTLLKEQVRILPCLINALKTCHRDSVCFYQMCLYKYDLDEVFEYQALTEEWCPGPKDAWVEMYQSLISQLSRVRGAGAAQTLAPSSTEREVTFTIKVQGLAINEANRLAIMKDITAALGQSPQSVTLTAGADGQTEVKMVFLSAGSITADELSEKIEGISAEDYVTMLENTKAANPDLAVDEVGVPVVEKTTSAAAPPFLGLFALALALLF